MVDESEATAAPSSERLLYQVVRLLCCLEVIDRKLQLCDPSDRWHWTSRRNSAVFLLNRLANTATRQRVKISVQHLTVEQRRALSADHPLLGPLSAYVPQTSEQIRSDLGDEVREILNQLHAR